MDTTYGTMFIGGKDFKLFETRVLILIPQVLFVTFYQGVLTLQAYIYHEAFPDDPVGLKALVAGVCVHATARSTPRFRRNGCSNLPGIFSLSRPRRGLEAVMSAQISKVPSVTAFSAVTGKVVAVFSLGAVGTSHLFQSLCADAPPQWTLPSRQSWSGTSVLAKPVLISTNVTFPAFASNDRGPHCRTTFVITCFLSLRTSPKGGASLLFSFDSARVWVRPGWRVPFLASRPDRECVFGRGNPAEGTRAELNGADRKEKGKTPKAWAVTIWL
ncbi:hypothetical protein FB451DRAFT_1188019 [Mycena latifolia]|nr:hypothetical protein FB451DRAFT_1188019 [Mycena latifolia]